MFLCSLTTVEQRVHKFFRRQTSADHRSFHRHRCISPGSPSSDWIATAIPPLAVPSIFVRMIPVRSATSAELSCLSQCVLSGCGIQHYQCLTVCVRIFPVNDPVDLSQFFHQVLLIVQTSCRIAKKDIRVSCFRRRNRVINDCRRVCFPPGRRSSPRRHGSPILLTVLLPPRGMYLPPPESLSLPCAFEFSCKLSYRCCLSHTVDTDRSDTTDCLFLKSVRSLSHLHLLFDAVDQKLPCTQPAS